MDHFTLLKNFPKVFFGPGLKEVPRGGRDHELSFWIASGFSLLESSNEQMRSQIAAAVGYDHQLSNALRRMCEKTRTYHWE